MLCIDYFSFLEKFGRNISFSLLFFSDFHTFERTNAESDIKFITLNFEPFGKVGSSFYCFHLYFIYYSMLRLINKFRTTWICMNFLTNFVKRIICIQNIPFSTTISFWSWCRKRVLKGLNLLVFSSRLINNLWANYSFIRWLFHYFLYSFHGIVFKHIYYC